MTHVRHLVLEISPVYEGIKTDAYTRDCSVISLEISPVYEGIKTLTVDLCYFVR